MADTPADYGEADVTWQEFCDELDDIISSGYDGDFSGWHQKAMTDLVNRVPAGSRSDFWQLFINGLPETEGWKVEELVFLKKAFFGQDAKLVIE